MFTGLIEGMGTVVSITQKEATIKMELAVAEDVVAGYKVGDSLACNGCCLTAVAINRHAANGDNRVTVTVEMMPETVDRTNFKELKVGNLVNLERAMPANGRFEGHMVAGHVDACVLVLNKQRRQNAIELTVERPAAYRAALIAQGAVALNGVSLTIERVTNDSLTVGLIPHTQEETNLVQTPIGGLVNLETDMVAKYILAGMKFNAQTTTPALNPHVFAKTSTQNQGGPAHELK